MTIRAKAGLARDAGDDLLFYFRPRLAAQRAISKDADRILGYMGRIALFFAAMISNLLSNKNMLGDVF